MTDGRDSRQTGLRWTVFCLLAFAVGALTYAPLWFSDKILYDPDTTTYEYPAFQFHAETIRGEATPLINPYYSGGFPAFLSPIGSFVDPLNRVLIAAVHDSADAIHLRLLISVMLGIAAVFMCAYALRFSPEAAFVVAAAYLTGQTFAHMTPSLVLSGSFFVMPMLAAAIASYRRGVPVRFLLPFSALACWYAWVAGFIQVVFYAHLFAFGFALFLDYRDTRWDFRKYMTTRFVLAASAAGALLAVPFLVATAAFKDVTVRQAGFGAEAFGNLRFVDLMHFILPEYTAIPFLSSTLPIGLYIGALPFLLACIGAVYAWRRRNPEMRYATIAYGTGLLLVLPAGLSSVIQHLPVFSLFHENARWLAPGVFFAALLAGYGLDMVRRGADGADFPWTAFLRTAGFVGIATLAVMTVVAAAFALMPLKDPGFRERMLLMALEYRGVAPLPENVPHYSAVFDRALSDVRERFSLAEPEAFVPVLCLLLAILLLFLFRRGMERRTFLVLAIALVAANAVAVPGVMFDRYISRATLGTEPELARYTRADTDQAENRMIDFLVGDALYRNVHSNRVLEPDASLRLNMEALVRNTNAMSHVPRLDGYEPYRTARIWRFFDEIVATETLVLGNDTFEEALVRKKEEFYSHIPILSSLGVRHILSGYPLDDARVRLVATSTKTEGVTLYLYENRSVKRMAYIPPQVTIVREWSDDLFGEISAGGGAVGIVECAECGPGTSAQSGALSIIDAQPASLRFAVSLDKPTWILTSYVYVPGWMATIDGEEVPVRYGNYLGTAIWVPSGDHEIEIAYAPSELIRGYIEQLVSPVAHRFGLGTR